MANNTGSGSGMIASSRFLVLLQRFTLGGIGEWHHLASLFPFWAAAVPLFCPTFFAPGKINRLLSRWLFVLC